MKKKFSIVFLLLSCFLVFIITYVTLKSKYTESASSQNTEHHNNDYNMFQTRLKEYKFIQPLILADLNNESASLISLRTSIEKFITQKKENQEVEDISVYFRRLNDGSWFNINPNKVYNPAGMSKLIELIVYLKEAEENPSILNKKIFFPKHFSIADQKNSTNFKLKEKINYSVKDLLFYMITYSDNDATILLNLNMNMRIYKQLFIDLNIPAPPASGEYFISAVDFSKLFRVLYNGAYLRPEYSEYGLSLLNLSTFQDGLRKGVDSSVVIANKFGERIDGNKTQFHEFGIFYVENDPYLLGVMTMGESLTQQKRIATEISKIAYSEYSILFK